MVVTLCLWNSTVKWYSGISATTLTLEFQQPNLTHHLLRTCNSLIVKLKEWITVNTKQKSKFLHGTPAQGDVLVSTLSLVAKYILLLGFFKKTDPKECDLDFGDHNTTVLITLADLLLLFGRTPSRCTSCHIKFSQKKKMCFKWHRTVVSYFCNEN